jgi:hypothetical protein
MSETIAATFAAVAREVEQVIDAARAADPGFDQRVNAFGGFELRAIFIVKPTVAFRVELVRDAGEHVESWVIGDVAPPPRDTSASLRPH